MTVISCGNGEIEFGPGLPTVIVHENLRVYDTQGENLALVESLARQDYSHLVACARAGIEHLDCQIVDLNLDHPRLNAEIILPQAAMAIHQATGQAVSLDSRNPAALRKVCEVYPGKPIINSIAAEDDLIQQLMPIVAEFNTAVILICTDESGIPETVEDTLRVAERLVKTAENYHIPLEDIILDTVTKAASVSVGSMQITLDSLRAVRKEFGCSTMLGVTNAGFGMPGHGLINQAFIVSAIAAGLDLILAGHEDPVIPLLLQSKLAMDFLTARDPYGKAYLAAYRADPAQFGSQ